jgi:hypothetical protein
MPHRSKIQFYPLAATFRTERFFGLSSILYIFFRQNTYGKARPFVLYLKCEFNDSCMEDGGILSVEDLTSGSLTLLVSILSSIQPDIRTNVPLIRSLTF